MTEFCFMWTIPRPWNWINSSKKKNHLHKHTTYCHMSECVPLKGPIHFNVKQLMPFREQTPRSETILWTERQLNAWMQWNSSTSRKVLEHRFSHLNKKKRVTGYQTQKGHMGSRGSVSTATDMLLYISAVYTTVNWNLDVWMVICASPATMAYCLYRVQHGLRTRPLHAMNSSVVSCTLLSRDRQYEFSVVVHFPWPRHDLEGRSVSGSAQKFKVLSVQQCSWARYWYVAAKSRQNAYAVVVTGPNEV